MPTMNRMNFKQSPIFIIPTTFELLPGQTILLEAYFSPQSAKDYLQEMVLTCDNCHSAHFMVKGESLLSHLHFANPTLPLLKTLNI